MASALKYLKIHFNSDFQIVKLPLLTTGLKKMPKTVTNILTIPQAEVPYKFFSWILASHEIQTEFTIVNPGFATM